MGRSQEKWGVRRRFTVFLFLPAQYVVFSFFFVSFTALTSSLFSFLPSTTCDERWKSSCQRKRRRDLSAPLFSPSLPCYYSSLLLSLRFMKELFYWHKTAEKEKKRKRRSLFSRLLFSQSSTRRKSWPFLLFSPLSLDLTSFPFTFAEH